MVEFVVLVYLCAAPIWSEDFCAPVYRDRAHAASKDECKEKFMAVHSEQFQGTPERPFLGIACVLKGKDS